MTVLVSVYILDAEGIYVGWKVTRSRLEERLVGIGLISERVDLEGGWNIFGRSLDLRDFLHGIFVLSGR